MSVSAFFEEISGGMTKQEAFMALLLSSVWIDRRDDAREIEEKRALEKRSRTLAALSADQIREIKERLRSRTTPDRINHLIEDACTSLANENADVRLSIFAHCTDIVFADRRLDKSEKSFLTDLSHRLSLDEKEAALLLRALKDKNRVS